MKIKNKLKKIRQNNNLRQDEVAKHLNISVRQYRNIETKTPKSVKHFYKLAKLFNTTIDYLLEQEVDYTNLTSKE